jgi:hypothetical protein
MRVTRAGWWTMAAMVAIPAALSAQVRASEAGSVAQTVDGTTITVEYSRPRIRDRRQIYGKVIPWGEVWTPGANWATTLETTNDITVNGHRLAKGKYSVWMQVEPKEWTVIFDPRPRLFHLDHPKPDSNQVRFAVTPDKVTGPDVLTWSFPKLSATGMTLEMAWAGMSVPLAIVVPQSLPLTFPADLAPQYTGTYSFSFVPDTSAKAPADSAPPKPSTWHVNYTNDMLLVDWVPPPFEEWSKLVLIKFADNLFHPGSIVNGELFDEEMDLGIEFQMENGRATGFEVRGENDQLLGTGTRTK